jgi:hypothetical protein
MLSRGLRRVMDQAIYPQPSIPLKTAKNRQRVKHPLEGPMDPTEPALPGAFGEGGSDFVQPSPTKSNHPAPRAPDLHSARGSAQAWRWAYPVSQ